MKRVAKLRAGVVPARSAPSVEDLPGLVDMVEVRVGVSTLGVLCSPVVENALTAGCSCPADGLPPARSARGSSAAHWNVQPGVGRLPPPMASVTFPVPGDDGEVAGHLGYVQAAVGVYLATELLDHCWRDCVPQGEGPHLRSVRGSPGSEFRRRRR